MNNVHCTLLVIAKMKENINADHLLNEVGCVCSMDYHVGIQKDDVHKDIYTYNIPSSVYIHIHICITIHTHSKHTHTQSSQSLH